jgi:hypothetical protein
MLYKLGDVIRINDDTQGFRNVRGVVVGFDNETEEVMFRIIAKGYIGVDSRSTHIRNTEIDSEQFRLV